MHNDSWIYASFCYPPKKKDLVTLGLKIEPKLEDLFLKVGGVEKGQI